MSDFGAENDELEEKVDFSSPDYFWEKARKKYGVLRPSDSPNSNAKKTDSNGWSSIDEAVKTENNEAEYDVFDYINLTRKKTYRQIKNIANIEQYSFKSYSKNSLQELQLGISQVIYDLARYEGIGVRDRLEEEYSELKDIPFKDLNLRKVEEMYKGVLKDEIKKTRPWYYYEVIRVFGEGINANLKIARKAMSKLEKYMDAKEEQMQLDFYETNSHDDYLGPPNK